jgi:hypothetical protein
MRSAAMARSAFRAYWRDFGRAVDESLEACEPDGRGMLRWPLAEHCLPVERRWAGVLRWVRRETGRARGRFGGGA